METATILVVDDNTMDRVLLYTNLREAGYRVQIAENGEQALATLKSVKFDLVLLDLIMPVMDGYQVLERMKDDMSLRLIPVIVLTSIGEMDSVTRCIEKGAADYLFKPFEPVILHVRIRASLATKCLVQKEEQHRLQLEECDRGVEDRVRQRAQQLCESLESLRRMYDGTVLAMAKMAEAREPYALGHSRRVGLLSAAIANKLMLTKKQCEGLAAAAALHDIGKVCIPSALLHKQGILDSREREVVSTHPAAGAEFLQDIDFPWPVAKIVHQHHERVDGSGYPSRLKGEGILMEARVLGIADVVEAMSFPRPWRPALGTDEALAEITRKKGVLYDSDVVEACLAVFKKRAFSFEGS